ncbi:uncharacterized protein LOC110021906 [Phalaenopsis equestris]|uniref:uncharacterized protein LOC110021906 n=1 Tax=Phalaenopsis equestris TaxID=78828 RepID=UPI0009E30951|nr:uncharacterized protein LOC110021906 [Phalaenopsis equestris]
MTRGNQRDRDRERSQARKAPTKLKEDGLTPEQRRERDKKALEEKISKKAGQGTSGEGSNAANNSKGSVKK